MKFFGPLFLSLLAIAGVIISNWIIVSAKLCDWNDRAAFGSMFGVSSAIFSGLAFSGLVFTIARQRSDFQANQKELKNQQCLSRRIQFENCFFQLISGLNESICSIKYRDKKGVDAIRIYKQNLKQCLRSSANPKVTYKTFYSQYEINLSHYYRKLQSILDFILSYNIREKRLTLCETLTDESILKLLQLENPEGVKLHTKLVISQLNDDLLFLIYYHYEHYNFNNSKSPFLFDYDFPELLECTHFLKIINEQIYSLK